MEASKNGKEILNDQLAANVLLAHILKKNKEFLIAHAEEEISQKDYENYISLVRRHHAGEPVPQLTGLKEFFGLDFYVNKDVLIPRPETELIVEKIIELVDKKYNGGKVKILDVGTGSGNIAVSLAYSLKNAQVTAVDISEDALKVAEKNIKNHKLDGKIQIFTSDLLLSVHDKFDFIAANLPYIGRQENNFVAFEVENFEPHVALFGGSNGLELYEKLFGQIVEKGSLNGYLLGEIGFSQKEKLEKLIIDYFPGTAYEFFQDLAGFDRYFVVNCFK